MKYNFDEIVSRKENNCVKYEESVLHYGTNDILPMWIADMDFKTAPQIIEAIQKKLNQGIFGYTYRPKEYFESYKKWQLKRNGYDMDSSLMGFTPGVIPGMRILLKLITKENANILISEPVYNPFSQIILNSGRNLLVNKLIEENGQYSLDFEDLEEKLKKADLFILCNPHNPIGKVWTRDELEKIANLCLKYEVMVFSDEIHSDLILGEKKHICFASISKEVEQITTTFMAPSKTFNLAGLQVANILFPNKEILDKYETQIRNMDISRNNAFSVEATMSAFEYGEDWLEELLEYLRGNMKFINDYCKENIPHLKPNMPEATYLCWIDARALNMSDDELNKFLVEKAGVGLTKGSQFGSGGEGFLRMNTAYPRAIIKKALESIKKAIDER